MNEYIFTKFILQIYVYDLIKGRKFEKKKTPNKYDKKYVKPFSKSQMTKNK